MADKAQAEAVKLSRIERRVLALLEGLPPGGRALELAPGRGALSRALSARGWNVTALDFHPENFGPRDGAHILRGDLDRPLPFREGSFDLLVCCEGIEHLEHQYAFARELARVLRPGGRLALTTPNICNAASRLRFVLTGFYSLSVRPSSEFSRNRFIEHIYCLTFWQLRHILHTTGLQIERVSTDHIRRSSLALAPLWPLSRWFTGGALRSEEEPRQREANLEILRQMHTAALFFGRTTIVLARRGESTYGA
ncbi:class I SAM-dependent methyltransferase [bacterium]|nr:class I SAM-dependent methyltransferase [bacterium]